MLASRASPQTLLASLPPLAEADRERLQVSIVERFPNISAIDVTAAVRQMLGLLGRLQWALQSTASVSLIVGMVLIYALARDQARARRAERARSSRRWEPRLPCRSASR